MANPVPPIPPALAVEIEPFTDAELDAAIGAALDGREIPARVGNFEITDDGRAEWAMRKLVAIDRRAADAASIADYWRERIDDYERQIVGGAQLQRAIFAAALERYAVIRRRETKDAVKTITLPSGTIPTRKPTKSVVHIADGREDDVARFIEANMPEGDDRDKVLRITRKVLVSELRKVVDIAVSDRGKRAVFPATGETIPGCYVVDPEITADVKPDLT